MLQLKVPINGKLLTQITIRGYVLKIRIQPLCIIFFNCTMYLYGVVHSLPIYVQTNVPPTSNPVPDLLVVRTPREPQENPKRTPRETDLSTVV